MWRRIRQIFLPILVIIALVTLICLGAFRHITQAYHDQANLELSGLVGAVAEKYPEIASADLIRALDDQSTEAQQQAGRKIFQQYGYVGDDFFASSTHNLIKEFALLGLSFIVLLTIGLMLYFIWRDWRRTRRIKELVGYLQDLSNQIYDLKLEKNSEDELSILTNELYKITVVLKEAAENNRKLAENLEKALADISHQLRTPLTSLQIMADSLYEDPEMAVTLRQDFLRSMSQQVETMSELVATLLHLAQLDNGSLEMNNQWLKIGDLLNKVKERLAVLADLQEVKIEIVGSQSAMIKLDENWQSEALSNIVKNAIEHSKVGQTVTIRVEDCPLFLRIEVIDTGEGMSLSDQKHIFERFYRVADSKKDSVGIGLAFAKAVILANNGQISVDSELGKGTKFIIKYFK